MRVIGRWTLRLLAAVGALVILVTATPVTGWYGRRLGGSWTGARGEVLIVLGGSIQNDGLIGLDSYWRTVYALHAWRRGGFRRIVISGGGAAATPVSAPMRDLLVWQGVPAAAITIETESASTHENALRTAERLRGTPGTKVLLTSDYHMFRAVRTFRKAGLEVLPRPYPDAAMRVDRWNLRWALFNDLCLETVKIAYYWCRGWM